MTDVLGVEAVAERCGPRAWRLACSLMGHAADAEDVLQDAFVVAATRADRVPQDDPWPWFATVVSNVARNARRKRARRAPPAPLGEDEDVTQHIEDGAARDPADRTHDAALARRLARLVDGLDEPEREAVALTHMAGLSLAAAASAAGVAKSTLQTRLDRALGRLAEQLRRPEAELVQALAVAPLAAPLAAGRAEGWAREAALRAGRVASRKLAGAAVAAALLATAGLVALAGEPPAPPPPAPPVSAAPAEPALAEPAQVTSPAVAATGSPSASGEAPSAPALGPTEARLRSDEAAAAAGLLVEPGPDGRPLVSLRARDAEVRLLALAIAVRTDASLTLSPTVRARCSVELRRALPEEALERLALATNGEVLALVDRRYRHVRLETESSLGVAVGAWPLVGASELDARATNALLAELQAELGPEGRVELEPATGTLLARGSEVTIPRLERRLADQGRLGPLGPTPEPRGAPLDLFGPELDRERWVMVLDDGRRYYPDDVDIREALLVPGPGLGKPVFISPNTRGQISQFVHRGLPAELSLRALLAAMGTFELRETDVAWCVGYFDELAERVTWPLTAEARRRLADAPRVVHLTGAHELPLEAGLRAMLDGPDAAPSRVVLDLEASLLRVEAGPVIAARLRVELARAGLVEPAPPLAPVLDPPDTWRTHAGTWDMIPILEQLGRERPLEGPLEVDTSRVRGSFAGQVAPSSKLEPLVRALARTVGQFSTTRGLDGVLRVACADEQEPPELARCLPASPRLALAAWPLDGDGLQVTVSRVGRGGVAAVASGPVAVGEVSVLAPGPRLRLEVQLLDRDALELRVWTDGLGPETTRWRVHPACWRRRDQ